ncbi:hypothetical protein Q7271_01280 [Glaesserella parasuis]|nr:hypothetical protein [Glaesserella parasuis]MDP0178935.1 hypothetical protein [Glaesserella parasuis]MDP0218769.1 hypothetical protein [Glaesserella parasuis]MDP0225247.1 hypothetical protein [Glaesserella parasuis]MDP0229408.1 hypothetical protein [Glaesserella parasuis]
MYDALGRNIAIGKVFEPPSLSAQASEVALNGCYTPLGHRAEAD